MHYISVICFCPVTHKLEKKSQVNIISEEIYTAGKSLHCLCCSAGSEEIELIFFLFW